MKKIAIRLDAGKSIGIGHLMRCMALAENLQKEAEVSILFICRDKIQPGSKYEVMYLDKPYYADGDGYSVPTIYDEIDELGQILNNRQIDCLIIDHYGAGDDYFKSVREFVPWLICIEDGVKRSIPVDMIINGNVYGTESDYGSIPIQLLGGEYTLLRKEFANLPKRILRGKIQDVYITSGGSDPLQFCKSIIEALQKNIAGVKIHVIAGSSFEENYIMELEGYDVVVHKGANMLACMQSADLFISSAGSTLYELAVTGTPSISYILADNQIRVAKRMWEEKCSMSGGYFEEFSPEKLIALYKGLIDFKARQKMSEKAQKTIHSDGAANAARQIVSLINSKKEMRNE